MEMQGTQAMLHNSPAAHAGPQLSWISYQNRMKSVDDPSSMHKQDYAKPDRDPRRRGDGEALLHVFIPATAETEAG